MFEVMARDAAGRRGVWSFGNHKVETPEIAVVVNPNKLTVPPEELKKTFGAGLIITNAYIVKKSRSFEEIRSRGLHRFLGWGGPIYTDSGTYQMHSQGEADIAPEETIRLQAALGSDIITPLDMFTEPTDTRDVAINNVNETLHRVNMAQKIAGGKELVGPIQGGRFLDLRASASSSIARSSPGVFAIGGIVPLMEQYRYLELAKIVISCKKNLPANRPVHAFGAGHPMLFALLAACGIDLFDSAAYVLYAEDGRYMTVSGTLKVDELDVLPCECPVCSSHTARELDVNLLARHNLYVTFAELRAIKQAIADGRLWDLVRIRAMAHPALFSAYNYLLSEYGFFEQKEPLSKRSQFFFFDKSSLQRPDIKRALLAAGKIKSKKWFNWYGKKIPDGLSGVYPFSTSAPQQEQNRAFARTPPEELLRSTLEYQYGKSATKILKKGLRIEVSKSTGRIRRAFLGKELFGTIRSRDGFFVPTLFGAKELVRAVGKDYSVVVSGDAAEYVLEGKSVFSKFVDSCGRRVRPGAEVFVVDKNKEVIACGTAKMNAKEMLQFKRGIAVDTRHSSDL